MKITDSKSIKSSENELIDGLIGELDWEIIEAILKEKYRLRLHDDVEYTSGDIVVHGGKIAYKLNFDVRVTLSLLVGRDGECFDIIASGSQEDGEDEDRDSESHELPVQADVSVSEYFEKKKKQAKTMNHEKNVGQLIDIINDIND